MNQFTKNAVVAIVGTNFEGKQRIHLLHFGSDCEMRGAFYYGERGEILHESTSYIKRLTHFREDVTYQEWSNEYQKEGLIVESFVSDPTKLTPRDYKRMARKAHKLMKCTPRDHVWHIFADKL